MGPFPVQKPPQVVKSSGMVRVICHTFSCSGWWRYSPPNQLVCVVKAKAAGMGNEDASYSSLSGSPKCLRDSKITYRSRRSRR